MRMQRFWDSQGTTGVWAGYYDGDTNAQTYNFFTRRAAVVNLLDDEGKLGRILDVGCGTGDYIEVADKHDGSFFGIDYAHGMIIDATKRIPGHGQRHLFVTGSGDKLPYRDDLFDCAIALGYIEYFPEPDGPMEELKRVIKPGGLLVMQSYKKDVMSAVDDYVIDPLKAVLRPIRTALGAKLGPSKPPLPDDWYDQKYSKGELDRLAARHGFKAERWTYNNFHLFPKFMMRRYPGAYIGLSERIQRRCPNLLGFTAVNYIAKYRLEG